MMETRSQRESQSEVFIHGKRDDIVFFNISFLSMLHQG